jgi:hypothetical protein
MVYDVWISLGPYGFPESNNDVSSGQVNAIAVDPRDHDVIYVGASKMEGSGILV